MVTSRQPADTAATGHAYVALDVADAWFAARAISAWAMADEAARRGAILRASEWIDGYFRFRGQAERPDQPRAWPRVDVMPQQAHTAPLPVMPAPTAVIEATLELAAALLDGENSAEQLLGARGPVRGERIGTLSVSYAAPAPGQTGRLLRLLAPYLATETTTRIVRS